VTLLDLRIQKNPGSRTSAELHLCGRRGSFVITINEGDRSRARWIIARFPDIVEQLLRRREALKKIETLFS